MTTHTHSLAFPVSALALAVLSACGGGSTSDAPTSVTLSGQVFVNGAIKNTVVCLDLNANNLCDAGEPASIKTGADGAYSMTFERSAVSESAQAAASVIARILPGTMSDPSTAIDQNDQTTTVTMVAYSLKQVPGKAGQINPLTTLVAAGTAAGMTEATARTNVAFQLGITTAKIDNYQDDPAFNMQIGDSARLMAMVTATALEEGAVLSVGDPTTVNEAVPGDMRSLRYTDASNYNYLDFTYEARAAGAPSLNIKDVRAGKTAGVANTSAMSYNQAYLGAAGWTRCDDSVPIVSRLGTPSLSSFCGASTSVSFRKSVSVADRTMADVVTEQQTKDGNVINTGGLSTTALLGALGSVKFPAGSTVRPGKSLNINQPIYINSLNSDGRAQSEATTLEQLVAAKPASAVNLATSGGSLSLGITSGPLKNLRVAFGATANTVQFYECDLNAAQTVASNCVATQTGTYAIETVNGARVMRFAGHVVTTMNNIRVYVEVKASHQTNSVTSGDWVYQARQNKPDVEMNITSSNRLNATAWTAMKTQLGL